MKLTLKELSQDQRQQAIPLHSACQVYAEDSVISIARELAVGDRRTLGYRFPFLEGLYVVRGCEGEEAAVPHPCCRAPLSPSSGSGQALHGEGLRAFSRGWVGGWRRGQATSATWFLRSGVWIVLRQAPDERV